MGISIISTTLQYSEADLVWKEPSEKISVNSKDEMKMSSGEDPITRADMQWAFKKIVRNTWKQKEGVTKRISGESGNSSDKDISCRVRKSIARCKTMPTLKWRGRKRWMRWSWIGR